MKKVILEYELPIKILSDENGVYVAKCPSWSDCYAQGDSVDEAVLEITAVAQSLIELYKEEGMKIPLKKAVQRLATSAFSIPVVVSA